MGLAEKKEGKKGRGYENRIEVGWKGQREGEVLKKKINIKVLFIGIILKVIMKIFFLVFYLFREVTDLLIK